MRQDVRDTLENEVMTTQEVADYLGLPRGSSGNTGLTRIIRLCDDEKIEYCWVGNRRYIDKEDLEDIKKIIDAPRTWTRSIAAQMARG